jgi:hypothetical protein
MKKKRKKLSIIRKRLEVKEFFNTLHWPLKQKVTAKANPTSIVLWEGLPAYDNLRESDISMTLKFKFKSKEDFEEFHKLAKKYMYNNENFIAGTQKLDKKTCYYPALSKSKYYKYVGQGHDPLFPIYIVSKSRWKRNPTSDAL